MEALIPLILDATSVIAAGASAAAAIFAYKIARDNVKATIFSERMQVFEAFMKHYHYWREEMSIKV